MIQTDVSRRMWVCVHAFGNSIHKCFLARLYRIIQEEWSIFWEVIISVILIKNIDTNMWLILNGYRDTALWLYSILSGKKEDKLFTVKFILIKVLSFNDKSVTQQWNICYSSQYMVESAAVNLNSLVCKSSRVVRLCWYSRLCMHVAASKMRASNQFRVSTFRSHTSLCVKPHQQKSDASEKRVGTQSACQIQRVLLGNN
jgi:hypothetical protein